MKSVVIAALVIMSATAQPLLAQADAPLPVMQPPEASPAMVLPANTAVMLRMNSDLSSKTAKEGSMFDLSVADPVMVDGYVVIPMNARAVGEVTWLTGKGAFGKSGKMNIELRYIEVAGRRIPIKGSFRQEGEGNTAATIGGVIAAGVFAGFITALGVFGFAPLAVTVALVGFEVAVAFLQAYIFVVLTCIYLNDAIHMH